jgi:uncharacterized membrane protein
MPDDSHRPHHVERRGPRSAIPIIIGLALLVAVWLIPDLSPRESLPVQGDQQLRARLVEAPGAPDAQGVVTARVELLEGDRSGEHTDALVQGGTMGPGIPGVPVEYRAGDEVMVTTFTGPAGGTQAQISDTWRVPVLAALAALFALAVVLVGGWRGLTSLLALALTLLVVVKVMVPLTLRGADPVILAVGIAAALTVVSLLLTEGPRRSTLAAMLGTGLALALTAGLAAAFTALARFSALGGSEEIGFLIPLLGERLDPRGLLLAATILGALGVLDDVTMTQAATVEQLALADPRAPRRQIFQRAMEVGRSHIAAIVNTLVLAYLGAGLPLLLLFAVGTQSPLTILNGEIVAVEVVRALVGSIGIVAAVPLTTLIAAWLVPAPGERASEPARPAASV